MPTKKVAEEFPYSIPARGFTREGSGYGPTGISYGVRAAPHVAGDHAQLAGQLAQRTGTW